MRFLDVEAFCVHLQTLFWLALIIIYTANIAVRGSQVEIVVTLVRFLDVKAFCVHL
jgi:hypothetical protein